MDGRRQFDQIQISTNLTPFPQKDVDLLSFYGCTIARLTQPYSRVNAIKTKLLSLLLLAGLALSACKPAATAEPEHAEETTDHAIHWTYEGEEGPDHWGDLAPDYATCGTGTSQSPIDLTMTPSGFHEHRFPLPTQ